jgi:hypothetical protein
MKGRNSWQYFAGLHYGIILCRRTHLFSSPALNAAFSPISDKRIDFIKTVRTSIYVVLNFLNVTSLEIVFKLKCACVLYVSYSNYAQNI